ncbi:NAD-specific glutamate dehydrogenase [compost metagenome]
MERVFAADRHHAVALDDGMEIARAFLAIRRHSRHLRAKCVRTDIGEHHFAQGAVARFHSCGNRSAQRDGLVGIDMAQRQAAEHAGHQAADHRHARGAAHQHDVVQCIRLESCVADGAFDRHAHALQQGLAELCIPGFLDRPLQVTAGKGDIETDPASGAEFTLDLFKAVDELRVLQAVQRRRIQAHILLEGQHQHLQEILAAQKVVSRAGVHFDDAVEQFQDRNVEGAAAQVQHEDASFFVALLQAIGQRCSRGLVDQSFDADAGQFSRCTRGFALCIGEIGRNADDGLFDLVAERGFGIGQQ